jgi:hypothetical protein
VNGQYLCMLELAMRHPVIGLPLGSHTHLGSQYLLCCTALELMEWLEMHFDLIAALSEVKETSSYFVDSLENMNVCLEIGFVEECSTRK